ncbi:MAG: hypothetical protein K5637_06765 [Lachnospiraceae bacterium]|nr:hypothetical protein [Lachnospiraceae bacterium]
MNNAVPAIQDEGDEMSDNVFMHSSDWYNFKMMKPPFSGHFLILPMKKGMKLPGATAYYNAEIRKFTARDGSLLDDDLLWQFPYNV